MSEEFVLRADMTLDQAVAGSVAQHPDGEALVFGDTRITYGQLGER